MTETPLAPRLNDTPEAALDRLRHVLDVCLALGAVDDLDRLLGHVLQTVQKVLRCDEAAVLLVHEPERVLRFAAATGDGSDALMAIDVPLHGSLAGTVVREDRPLLAVDVNCDARHFDAASEAAGLQVRSLLSVPMRVDGRPVGVLQALNPRDGAFDRADVEMLLVISAQAAVALRTARQQAALAEANHRLADLNRLKTNFMSIASHELRTPLTAVQGFGQILLEEAPVGLAPFADAVVRAGDRMMNVVETIDEMAALSADGPALPTTPVDLSDVLDRALGMLDRPIRVLTPHQPAIVEGDDRRLGLALTNLLVNADQFTPAGRPVTVEVGVDEAQAYVRVTDEGRGLESDDLDQIFEAFYQVADPDTRDHEGLGVGLTVARSIAVRHGGRLWATSHGLGHGSTFHLCLPLHPAAGDSAAFSAPALAHVG